MINENSAIANTHYVLWSSAIRKRASVKISFARTLGHVSQTIHSL